MGARISHRQKSGPSKFESVKLMKICDVINFVCYSKLDYTYLDEFFIILCTFSENRTYLLFSFYFQFTF